MNNSKTKSQLGLTLIEALIAIAIFAIFALLINSIFINVLRGATKQESLKEVKQNGDIALITMTNRIREATDLGTCPASANTISIINKDGTTTQLGLVSNRITAVTGTETEFLTNSFVRVTSLTISCNDLVLNPLITIDFVVEHINNINQPLRAEEHANMRFLTTVGLRIN
ncbi:MAG: prepilin-type N-terminal cleavage/methylation domain-containing protein [Candidatus Roizmanbacteria bacterium]|nr:prepilin-type N-terminal cleavage/methylation domain-containing protein [Candidatus Roizmanbacteria bacterium]